MGFNLCKIGIGTNRGGRRRGDERERKGRRHEGRRKGVREEERRWWRKIKEGREENDVK